MSGSNRFAKVRRCWCARARGPRPSPTAAGVVAEPPCVAEELTGGTPPSVSHREKGEGGSDERDPPGSARSARVGRAGVGRPAGRFPAARWSVFLFKQFLIYI